MTSLNCMLLSTNAPKAKIKHAHMNKLSINTKNMRGEQVGSIQFLFTPQLPSGTPISCKMQFTPSFRSKIPLQPSPQVFKSKLRRFPSTAPMLPPSAAAARSGETSANSISSESPPSYTTLNKPQNTRSLGPPYSPSFRRTPLFSLKEMKLK